MGTIMLENFFEVVQPYEAELSTFGYQTFSRFQYLYMFLVFLHELNVFQVLPNLVFQPENLVIDSMDDLQLLLRGSEFRQKVLREGMV
jgi:hypothetical protein